MEAGLCELHAHLGGCIEPGDIAEMIRGREIDWSYYEAAYRRAYGRDPGLRQALARLAEGAREPLDRLFIFGDEDAGHFDKFSAKFLLVSAVSELTHHRLMREGFTPGARAECRRLLRRLADRCRAAGVRYHEVRAALSSGVSRETRRAVYVATLEAMLEASDEGCTLVFTPGLPRDDPGPAWGLVKELALGELGQALVGVDFCHVEEGFCPRLQAPLARDLRRFNERHPGRALALLYHVGESYRDRSLASAVRWVDQAATLLGAHRLGHAIALGVDPAHHDARPRREPVSERRDQIAYDLRHADELRAAGVPVDPDALKSELARLASVPGDASVECPPDLDQLAGRQRVAIAHIKAAGAVIEVCPTSNRRIAGLTDSHHPVHRFLAEGLPFVVGSDDPGILGTTLAGELAWLRRHAGLDDDAMEALRRRSWASRSVALSGRGG